MANPAPPRGLPMPQRTPKALMKLGREFQIGVFQAHLQSHPDDVEVLESIGHLLTRSGRHQEGLRADQRLVELRPEEPVAHYNLACSRCLVGDVDGALASLAKALELGYRELDAIRRDPDLK